LLRNADGLTRLTGSPHLLTSLVARCALARGRVEADISATISRPRAVAFDGLHTVLRLRPGLEPASSSRGTDGGSESWVSPYRRLDEDDPSRATTLLWSVSTGSNVPKRSFGNSYGGSTSSTSFATATLGGPGRACLGARARSPQREADGAQPGRRLLALPPYAPGNRRCRAPARRPRTRKTTPGCVRGEARRETGAGHNTASACRRILIKDNTCASAASPLQFATRPQRASCRVECETLDDVRAAVEAGRTRPARQHVCSRTARALRSSAGARRQSVRGCDPRTGSGGRRDGRRLHSIGALTHGHGHLNVSMEVR